MTSDSQSKISKAMLFFYGFYVLIFQINLALLFNVFTRIPFLALTFAFLGLTAGGVAAYLSKADSNEYSGEFLGRRIFRFALMQLIFIVFFQLLNFVRFQFMNKPFAGREAFFDQMVGPMFLFSLLLGLSFSFVFYHLGFIATSIYRSRSEKSPVLYFYDLTGAAAGCAAGVFLLEILGPVDVLILMMLLSFLSVFLFLKKSDGNKMLRFAGIGGILFSAALLLINVSGGSLDLKQSCHLLARDYAHQEECREEWYGWNAFSRVSIVSLRREKDHDWRRYYALNNSEGLGRIVAYDPEKPFEHGKKESGYSDFYSRNPALLFDMPKNMLVLMAGAGLDIFYAYGESEGKSKITGVEINPMLINKVSSMPDLQLRKFFELPNVRMAVSEGRQYIESSDERYDAIFISNPGTPKANYLGVAANTGNYLYTVEAFETYLKALDEGGALSLLGHNKLQMLATLMTAAKKMGIDDISGNVIVYVKREYTQGRWILNPANLRAILYYTKDKISHHEIEKIRAKIEPEGNYIIYSPFFVHPNFTYYDKLIRSNEPPDKKLRELYGESIVYYEVPRDDRPFFEKRYHLNKRFFELFSDFLSFSPKRSLGLNQRADFTMIGLLAVIALIGFLIILRPLARGSHDDLAGIGFEFFIYFSGLGLGFILVEMALMHKLILLLGNPIYAFTIVLFALLIFTGFGSLVSQRLIGGCAGRMKKALRVTGAVLVLYGLLSGRVIAMMLPLDMGPKVLGVLTFIFPLGFLLGLFFSQSLKIIGERNQKLIPWAWAINGYAGLIGSMLSIYLAVFFGFSFFLLAGGSLYFLISFLNWKK